MRCQKNSQKIYFWGTVVSDWADFQAQKRNAFGVTIQNRMVIAAVETFRNQDGKAIYRRRGLSLQAVQTSAATTTIPTM